MKTLRFALLMTCIPTSVMRAQAVTAGALTRGTLSFDASATLGDFTGTTSTMTGHLDKADDIAHATGWVEAPSKTLNTNNGKRDRDMASSMEFEKYPVIRFDLAGATLAAKRGDSTAVTLHGKFTIHGQTKDADIPGWLWHAGESFRFRGATPLKVTDYGVGGLSKMLGLLKMKPGIVVRMDVVFQ